MGNTTGRQANAPTDPLAPGSAAWATGLRSRRAARVVGAAVLLLGVACSSPAASVPTAAPSVAAQPSAAPSAQASAAPSSSPSPAALAQIVAAAKQEGALQLVWGQTPFGGQSTMDQWIDGYKKAYGLDVNVTYTPGTDMATFSDASIQEYQAGKPASSDVIVGAATIMDSLIQAGDVQDGQWADWAPNIQNPALVAPGGIGVHIGGYFPGIEYNTQIFTPDTAPQSMQDLLKPEFKGKVASTPYAAHFDELASPDVWGEQRALDYVQQLSGQLAGLMRCGDDNRIISGEFPAFGFACGGWSVMALSNQGAPLGYVVPSDAAIIDYWYMSIPKNSAHPNAAKLWINYILSPDAQKIMWDTSYVDDPLVPGSHIGQQAADLRAKGANLTPIDVTFYERNAAEMKDALAQVEKIFQQK